MFFVTMWKRPDSHHVDIADRSSEAHPRNKIGVSSARCIQEFSGEAYPLFGEACPCACEAKTDKAGRAQWGVGDQVDYSFRASLDDPGHPRQ